MLVTRYFNRGYNCSTVRNTTALFRGKMEHMYVSGSGYGLYRRPRVDYIEAQRVTREYYNWDQEQTITQLDSVTITEDVVGPLDSVTAPPELPPDPPTDVPTTVYVRTAGRYFEF